MSGSLKAEAIAKFNSGKITEEQYLADMLFYEKQEKEAIESSLKKCQTALEAVNKTIENYEARLEELKGMGEGLC